jgi:hypothetical protein
LASEPLTREERDELVARLRDIDAQLFPPEGKPEPDDRTEARLRDDYLLRVAEYFDGLPRVVMSACPYCGAELRRSFDPWGVDGLWWGVYPIYAYEEPPACEHFRVLLGALALNSDVVPEVLMEVQPGPEVPFVVPRLLDIEGMVAVVGRLPLETGAVAYPIAYFSRDPVPPIALHQPWRRTMLWFKDERGQGGWTSKNDVWDFELQPHVDSGKLRWVDLAAADGPPEVQRGRPGRPCPFVGLPGERFPQRIDEGEREFLDAPSGGPIDPFGEDGGLGDDVDDE